MSTSQASQDFSQTEAEVIALQEADDRNRPSESLWRTALRRLSKDYLTMVAMMVIVVIALLAIFAPVIEDMLDVSYTATNANIDRLLPPGTENHILGTDNLGRDMFARLLYGGRISMSIGFSVAIFAGFIGVALGLIAGYYQGGPFGFIDDILIWFITTLASIPNLMLLILLASVLSPTVETLIFVLTFVSWAGTMRLIRGETLSYREAEYTIAARALGAGALRIMFVHILPNTLSILITSLAINIGTVILVEAALSFLGLGVRPPEPSWGNMLTQAQQFFREGPHMAIFPGLLITITVLSMYLIGDGLRDAFDPKSAK